MSTQAENQYGFISNKSVAQDIEAPNVGTVLTIVDTIVFDDDVNPPYFDNGNDMYTNKYIVPIGGIRQKFITENVNIKRLADVAQGFNDLTIKLAIYVNGVIAAGNSSFQKTFISANLTFPVGDVFYIPSFYTDYLILNEGDEVTVELSLATDTSIGDPAVQVMANARFSNSF